MITRNPSLTDQVKAHIKERIAADGFEDGRIPPETELATELGVSRTTVRDALSRLENEGTVFRRQGAGTFVSEPGLQIKSRLEDIWSYEQVLEDHGYVPSVRVLSEFEVEADEATLQALDLSQGDKVLVIEKLFLEDDDPVMLTINRIPSHILSDTEYADDEATPIYEFMEQHCNRVLSHYVSEIVPVAYEFETADRLGVEEGTLAVSFEEVGFDQNNMPIVRGTSFFRDDLIRFRLIRRRSGA